MTFDHILFWNDAALEANRMAHSGLEDPLVMGPVGSSRAFAIVHLAMHDAYRRATGLSTYLQNPPAAPAGASRQMAAGAAAHHVLAQLYPSQAGALMLRLGTATNDLVANGVTGIGGGMTLGVAIAAALLAERAGDPGADDGGYVPSMAPGRHRPDPYAADLDTAPSGPGIDYHGPFYGTATPFAVLPDSHPLDAPPALNSPEYVAALHRVRSKGIAPALAATVPASGRRTPEETLIGTYWGYDGANGLGTPPRLYNQIVRQLSMAMNTSEQDNAQLFTLVNVAIGDAGILAWREKYRHDLWRPILGIREHDTSMGPNGAYDAAFSADCDPEWLPLGAPKSNSSAKNFTPPFPAYPSGHATFGAAALDIARRFYGVMMYGPDPLLPAPNTFVSDECNGITRDNQGTVRSRHARGFPGGLWQMIEENGRSREYLGVHWIFDAFAEDANGEMDTTKNVGGVPLGLAIAKDIWERYEANMKQLLHP